MLQDVRSEIVSFILKEFTPKTGIDFSSALLRIIFSMKENFFQQNNIRHIAKAGYGHHSRLLLYC